MSIESLPEHIRKPHLRPIQPIPVQKDGKQFVALRDPVLVGNQSMVVSPQMMPILQHLRGDADIEQLSKKFNVQVEQFAELCKGLDKMGLLWGPTFEGFEADLLAKLGEVGAFPARVSGSLGDDGDACRAAIEKFIADTEDPEMDVACKAIVAPHLDYQRGWPNYAAAYRCLDKTPRPDRVVILGTNHFGIGDGVVLTEYGFQSPLGRCDVDDSVVKPMVDKLGRPAVVDQLDHIAEHSIELQLPWIQHRWGDVPVVAALVPDPITPMIEDDGKRLGREPFVAALRETLDEAGGTSLIVASADLSHVGPQFGEPRAVDEQRRVDVERHDREMLAKYVAGDAEEFVGAMKWNKNPTRWCSIGNMTAALELTDDASVELIDYRQAYDDNGNVMVTSAAIALT